MRQIDILSVLIYQILFFVVTKAEVVLWNEDLNGSIQSGWNTTSTVSLTCPYLSSSDPFDAYNQDFSSIFGMFGNRGGTLYNPSKIFSNLPPHWSLRVDLIVMLIDSLSTSNTVQITIDGSQFPDLVKYSWAYGNLCSPATSDQLNYFNQNITHSVSSVKISLYGQCPSDSYALSNLKIFVDECHESCLKCDGPAANQCTSCPVGANLAADKTCQCGINLFLRYHLCVSNCPTGYDEDSTNRVCVKKCQNCASCQSNLVICNSCNAGYYLWSGQCVLQCPSMYEPSGTSCILVATNSLNNGVVIMNAFDNEYFGNLEVQNLGFTYTKIGTEQNYGTPPQYNLITQNLNFNFFTNFRRSYTYCNGYKIFGGAGMAGGMIMSKSFLSLQPHFRARIRADVYMLDRWSGESILFKVDGVVVETLTFNTNTEGSRICGAFIYNDKIQIVSTIINHSSTSLSLSIEANIGQYKPFTQSFGLKNLYVVIDQCTSNCIVCDINGCLTCQAGFYLHNVDKLCYAICPAGFYGDATGVCLACSYQCATCVTSATNCLTCSGNRKLNQPTCSCPDGYYDVTGVANCSKCSYQCLTCDTSSTNCLTCAGNRTPIPACSCPSSTYDTSVATCPACHNFCITCSGVNQSNCLVCKPSSNRLSSRQCDCADGYYSDGTSIPCLSIHLISNYMFDCDYKCATCTTNATNCLTCSDINRDISNGCQCKPGYYETGVALCGQCNPKCSTCSGSADNCTTCAATRNNNPPLCDCPINLFENGALCTACSQKCNGCINQNANQCQNCNTGKNRGTPPNCNCLVGYYYAGAADMSCLQCDLNVCIDCSGSPTSCITCKDPNALPPICSCKPGYYYDNTTSICQKCHQNCATCNSGSKTDCITCTYNRINAPTCTCQLQTYDNGTNARCQDCDKSCKSCSGSLLTQCLSCFDDRILYQGKCICKAGLFEDGSRNCVSCPVKCSTCDQSGNCLSCSGIRTIQNNCNCPTGYYDLPNGQCGQCSSKCQECSVSSTQCTQCASLRSNPPYCDCSQGYFQSSTSNNCLQCNYNCSECSSSASVCASCSGNRISAPACVCPLYTYEDNSSQICPNCYRTCLKCGGPYNNQCTMCRPSYIYNNGNCYCSNGFFDNVLLNECQSCPSYCKYCQDQSTCVLCNSGYTLSNGKCIITSAQKDCLSGDICKECDLDGNCKVCQTGYQIIGGLCTCQPFQYYNSTQLNCINCDIQQCSRCKSSTECTLCLDGYILTEGSCQKSVVQYESTDAMRVVIIVLCTLIGVGAFSLAFYFAWKKYKSAEQFLYSKQNNTNFVQPQQEYQNQLQQEESYSPDQSPLRRTQKINQNVTTQQNQTQNFTNQRMNTKFQTHYLHSQLNNTVANESLNESQIIEENYQIRVIE